MIQTRLLFTLCAMLFGHILRSQGFEEVSTQYGIDMRNNGNSILGVGMSFADFDRDGWDDLTYCSANDSLVMYRNLEGAGFERMEIFPFTHDSKMATWVDYDNDGDADLLWTKRSGTTRFFRNDGDMQFTDVTSSLGITQNNLTHIYGCAWGDFNRDGWLDVHICTYSTIGNSRNFLCRNNQDGTFTDISSSAGVTDLASLTFQSAWQDFNGDHWPDLYVINDNNQSNRLYINNQNETFTDITTSAGVATNVQSMNIGIADYDHDHDWDIYITDSMDPNILWQNNGNLTFTNVSATANLEVNSFCWAGTWLDYDHDTWEDIYVATSTNILNQDFFYRNNGDGTFSDAGISSINTSQLFTYAAGKGDFNNDGFWDISVTCIGDTSYLLYRGIPNENHWVKVELEGTHSNRDAIGTQLDYYINGERYMRYTRCGEGYLMQNSTREILSLGTANQVDSLIITWPRGLVEKIYNLPAGDTYHFVEGENTNYAIYASQTALCGGSLALYAGDHATTIWNDNSTNDTLWVDAPGLYSVSVIDTNGYSFQASIEIVAGDYVNFTQTIEQPLCMDANIGSAIITAPDDVIITWSDNNASFERNELAPGLYSFELSGPGYCPSQGAIEIVAVPIVEPMATITDVLCFNGSDGSVALSIEQPVDSVVWDTGVIGTNLSDLSAGNYTATVFYNGVCSFSYTAEINSPEELTVSITSTDVSCNGANDGSVEWSIDGGTLPYTPTFSADSPSNLSGGAYSLVVLDGNGCNVESVITINEPNALEITNADIVDADNGATGSIAITVEGGTAPYDYLWSNGDDSNTADLLGQGDYTVEVTDSNGCIIAANYYITDIGITEWSFGNLDVFPNPARDRITIRFSKPPVGMIEIWNSMGQKIFTSVANGQPNIQLNVNELATGTYLVRYFGDHEQASTLLVVE